MSGLEAVRLTCKNFKCFGTESGFDTILPINLLVGRNNAGKSTLLDMLDYAAKPRPLENVNRAGAPFEILLTDIINEGVLRWSFSDNITGGALDGPWLDHALKWKDARITYKIGQDGSHSLMSIEPAMDIPALKTRFDNVITRTTNPFQAKTFKRLNADRDIVPEGETSNPPTPVSQNGSGATNAIRQYLIRAELNYNLVQKTILDALNEIMEPDSSFTSIVIKQYKSSNYEVFLDEPRKGQVALSQSGSGLRTVLLVLVFLFLVPAMESKQLSDYVFGFEELENSLHPSLQRRLFLFLRKIALQNHCIFFLATHSNIAIDLFSHDKDAQILHVTHDGDQASVARAVSYAENIRILDDLDVRASDLLQSNCVVWVEGPSDKRYFNKWIDLWSQGELREGAHYQTVFYGGSMLSQLSAADPDLPIDDLVNILKVNRNAILIMDSDRDSEKATISQAKGRMISEVTTMGGIAWLTAGRSIENYLPVEILKTHYTTATLNSIGKFESFPEYLEKIKKGEEKRFLRSKVVYAEKFSAGLTKELIAKTLDLDARLNETCGRIRAWNNLNPHPPN